MERYGVEFVEQPVLAADLDGLKTVHGASPIPVMADEAIFSPADALRLVRAEACASLNIKLMKAGGILNMVKIAHIADAAGMPCMAGAMVESRLALTAAAQVVAATAPSSTPIWTPTTPMPSTRSSAASSSRRGG